MITHTDSHHRHVSHSDAASPSRLLRWDALVGFIVLAFLAALPAIWIDTRVWYAELVKPAWAPPPGLFGPAWTMLYALMGIAAWGVWQQQGWRRPLAVWLMQLGLNAAWTPIFFGLHQPGWAFAEITLLWFSILVTMILFSRVANWTGWLLAPYLAWVSFAAGLNYEIWRLNG